MSSPQIGWCFPPTGGGQEDDFNHPGIAHFEGDPISSLAREVIQNSLDARENEDTTVHVEFDLHRIPSEAISGFKLCSTMKQCKQRAERSSKAKAYFENAVNLLQSNHLTFLRIADTGTTGLRGNQWHALVKIQGLSAKSQGAGGSFGIGKFAPFAMSEIRTVMYWTRFMEKSERVERFQGKSILMSHGSEKERSQGIGFYGKTDGCSFVEGEDIPSNFTDVDRGKKNVRIGTSIWIAGFRDDQGWQTRIASSIVANYFDAIGRGYLEVHIDPSQEMMDNNLFTITASSLQNWIDFIKNDQERASNHEVVKSMTITSNFCDLLKQETSIETEDKDLGYCKLWLKEGSSFQSRIGLVRKTGMLVTTKQRGLIRFNDLPNFISVLRFESSKGNELLRNMENPNHDQFEPNRLPEDMRARGERALRRIALWVRSEIGFRIGQSRLGKEDDVDELARLLPDINQEDPFDEVEKKENGGKEKRFGDLPVISLRPLKMSSSIVRSGVEIDPGPKPLPGPNPGPGPRPRPNPTPKPSRKARRARVCDLRVVPLGLQAGLQHFSVSFKALESSVVQISVLKAGDSAAEKLHDIEYMNSVRQSISSKNVVLSEGKRHEILFSTATGMNDCAWIVDITALPKA